LLIALPSCIQLRSPLKFKQSCRIISQVGRAFALIAGLLSAGVAAGALLLNWLNPDLACRWKLCPESQALTRAKGLLLSEKPRDRAAALALYKQLIRNNPASPYRWADLGDALLAAGKVSEAKECFRRVEQAGPGTPQTLLRAAGFYLRLGETKDTLRLMSLILSLTPAYDSLIFSYYDLMDLPPDVILEQGLPPGARAAQSYFSHVIKTKNIAAAGRLWKWLAERGFLDDALAGAYAQLLIGNGNPLEAARIWRDYAGDRDPGYLKSNFIFNPGFEREPAPSPFDWKETKVRGVELTRDSTIFKQGGWSLRIRFAGEENINYRHFSQLTPARAGRFRLSAYVKTDNLTTDQGVALRVYDCESRARLEARTASLRGTQDWARVETEFEVPASTRLLAVEVFREPTLKFDNKLAGTVWIDDVRLEPEGARSPAGVGSATEWQ